MAVLTPHRWLWLCLALCFGVACVQAGEDPARPVRLAVLDLQSPETTPWLGAAVREAVAVKLAGLDHLVLLERERMDAILAAKKGKNITPSLLGVEVLLTGSVQLVGTWPDPDAKIRISGKVLASETGAVKGDGAFVLDGTVAELFALETELASRTAAALGRDAPLLTLQVRDAQTLTARTCFGEGLLRLRQARALLPQTFPADSDAGRPSLIFATEDESNAATASGTRTEKEKKGASPGRPLRSASERTQAALLLQAAVDAFRAAQRENEGAFHARAHHYELQARTLLARVQPDDAAAKQVRAATVKQFRQDAAAAAPAFFDLGRALEANGEYQAAITAYGKYLRWVAETHQAVYWHKEIRWHPFRGTVYKGHWPPVFERSCRFLLDQDRVLYLEATDKEPTALVCLDRKTGQERWRNAAVVEDTPSSLLTSLYHDQAGAYGWFEQVQSPAVLAEAGRVFYLGDTELAVLDGTTGVVQKRIAHKLPPPSAPSNGNEFLFHPPGTSILVIGREYKIPHPDRTESFSVSTALDVTDGSILWQHKEVPYAVWRERVLYWNDDVRVRDLRTGAPAASPVPQWTQYGGILSSRDHPDTAHLIVHPEGSLPVHVYRSQDDPPVTRAPDAIVIRPDGGIHMQVIFPDQREKRLMRQAIFERRAFLLWDVRKRQWRRVTLPETLAVRTAAVAQVTTLPDACGAFRYTGALLCGDRLLLRPQGLYGDWEVYDLQRGSLLGRKRVGGREGQLALTAEGAALTACGETLQLSKLVPPRGTHHSTTAAHLRRAHCFLLQRDYRNVLAEANNALATQARVPEAHWLAGIAHEARGERLPALNAYYAARLDSRPPAPLHTQATAAVQRLLPIHLDSPAFAREANKAGKRLARVEVLADVGVLQLTYQFRQSQDLFFRIADGSLIRRLPEGEIFDTYAYLGHGDFLDRNTTGAIQTSVYNCLTGASTDPVVHQLGRWRSFYKTPRAKALKQHGVCLWNVSAGDRQRKVIVTDWKTGQRLWEQDLPTGKDGNADTTLAEGTVLAICTSGSAEQSTAASLAAWNAKTGTEVFRHTYALHQPGPHGSTPPYRPVQTWHDTQYTWQFFNGLAVLQDFRDRVFALDPKTGDLAPFPPALVKLGWIDTGLRGDARAQVMQAPSAYAQQQQPRRYLGTPGQSPYVRKRTLFHADGTPVGPAQPFCGFDVWPRPVGDFLVFRQYDRFLVVRTDAYLRFFGLRPAPTSAPAP